MIGDEDKEGDGDKHDHNGNGEYSAPQEKYTSTDRH